MVSLTCPFSNRPKPNAPVMSPKGACNSSSQCVIACKSSISLGRVFRNLFGRRCRVCQGKLRGMRKFSAIDFASWSNAFRYSSLSNRASNCTMSPSSGISSSSWFPLARSDARLVFCASIASSGWAIDLLALAVPYFEIFFHSKFRGNILWEAQ